MSTTALSVYQGMACSCLASKFISSIRLRHLLEVYGAFYGQKIRIFCACACSSSQAFLSPSLERPGNEASRIQASQFPRAATVLGINPLQLA